MYTTSAASAKSIYEKIWELSPKLEMPDSYAALQELTRELIARYDEQGRLNENPFTPTTKRKLSLPKDKINSLLKSSTCLVTGGLGCVGSSLVKRLAEFEVDKIIVLDKRSYQETGQDPDKRIVYVVADVCDEDSLNEVFQQYQPDYVFHTAAQRNPGYAESHVMETINLNIFGTLNLVNACENCESVQQCIFSSTGKASRYFTNEVYAATKKICEYIFDTYAHHSLIRYSFVRFTHILDNSLMNIELQNHRNADHLTIHSPGKYVTAQNVTEAADLMLNALIYAEPNDCNFLIVRNLEWPVESLEVALYYIKESGSKIPVVFKGNPAGYCEKFFRGQMDWSNPDELNLLINVYENKKSYYNEANDIIISSIIPTDQYMLQKALENIRCAKDENEMKECLVAELQQLVQSTFHHVDKQDTINILEWGLQPQYLAAEGTTMKDYGTTVFLLLESLEDATFLENHAYTINYGQ